MFQIYNTKENNNSLLVLENSQKTSSLKISLNEGGRVQELKLNNQLLIKDLKNFKYSVSYASSILFPFVSRLKGGCYTFLNTEYQIDKNDNNINALHGLVYDKTFHLVNKEFVQKRCSITLNYTARNRNVGFPFTYSISLIYTLSDDNLELKIVIRNIDEKPFPFTLGWHPYFFSDDLQNSTLNFKSDKKVVFDENLITKKIVEHTSENDFSLKDKQLDDCFFLKNNKVAFNTPKYSIEISSSAKENYLQLYTPSNKPIIAIEPMTGISNSFNNKIGLQVLKPNETYSIIWNVKCNSINDKK